MSTTSHSPIWRLFRPFVTNRHLIFLESVGSVVLAWAILAYGFGMQDTVSSPALVAVSTYELLISMEWVPHMWDTIRRIFFGFILAMLLGTALGILMGLSTFWERAFQDYISVGLAIPSLFIAVFAAMWFGTSDMTMIVTAAIAPFPFVAQNVYQGVKNIDYRLMEVAESFDVSRQRTIRRIVFRSVMPEWFAGVRYGFAGAWKLVTLAEVIAASSGVGFMIRHHLNLLSLTGVLTWTVLFGLVIMFIEYGILQQVEKRVFDWRENTATAW